MRNKYANIGKPQKVKCKRCGKRSTLEQAAAQNWNTVFDRGRATGYLCHECQTPAENLEAEVNHATIEYMGYDQYGRMWGRPKTSGERGRQ